MIDVGYGTAEEVAKGLTAAANLGASGEQLKLIGQARVDEAEDADWKDRADAAILELARLPSPFTAEDVREIAGDPSHPNAFGARLSANARRGIIRVYGYEHAARPSRHSALVTVWLGMPRALEP